MGVWSWCSVVGVVAKLQAGHKENHGLIPARGKIVISSSKCPHQLWAHPASNSTFIFLIWGSTCSHVGVLVVILQLNGQCKSSLQSLHFLFSQVDDVTESNPYEQGSRTTSTLF